MSLAPEEFVRRLTAAQPSLWGYVVAHIRDASRAEDVLQEICVVLWKKLDTYEEARPFLNWAMGVAHREILHARRDSARSKLVFDPELSKNLADRYQALEPALQPTRGRLAQCVEKLAPQHRDLVQRRYRDGRPIPEIAESLGKSVAAVHMALSRARALLADCVRLEAGR